MLPPSRNERWTRSAVLPVSRSVASDVDLAKGVVSVGEMGHHCVWANYKKLWTSSTNHSVGYTQPTQESTKMAFKVYEENGSSNCQLLILCVPFPFQLVAFAALIAVARAGIIGAPAVAAPGPITYAAPAVGRVAAPFAYAAPVAKVIIINNILHALRSTKIKKDIFSFCENPKR